LFIKLPKQTATIKGYRTKNTNHKQLSRAWHGVF